MNDAQTTTSPGEHPIDQKVLSLMDKRLETARDLADRASELATAKEQVSHAQRQYSDAYKAALKAGWETKQLSSHLELEEPEKPRRRRAPVRRASKPDESAADTQEQTGQAMDA